MRLWIPKLLCRDESQARQALRDKQLPFVWPADELALPDLGVFKGRKPRLVCASFLEAKTALERGGVAAFLPEFLAPAQAADRFVCLSIKGSDGSLYRYHLAWNPRLLRLNPHATRQRDFLLASLTKGT